MVLPSPQEPMRWLCGLFMIYSGKRGPAGTKLYLAEERYHEDGESVRRADQWTAALSLVVSIMAVISGGFAWAVIAGTPQSYFGITLAHTFVMGAVCLVAVWRVLTALFGTNGDELYASMEPGMGGAPPDIRYFHGSVRNKHGERRFVVLLLLYYVASLVVRWSYRTWDTSEGGVSPTDDDYMVFNAVVFVLDTFMFLVAIRASIAALTAPYVTYRVAQEVDESAWHAKVIYDSPTTNHWTILNVPHNWSAWWWWWALVALVVVYEIIANLASITTAWEPPRLSLEMVIFLPVGIVVTFVIALAVFTLFSVHHNGTLRFHIVRDAAVLSWLLYYFCMVVSQHAWYGKLSGGVEHYEASDLNGALTAETVESGTNHGGTALFLWLLSLILSLGQLLPLQGQYMENVMPQQGILRPNVISGDDDTRPLLPGTEDPAASSSMPVWVPRARGTGAPATAALAY